MQLGFNTAPFPHWTLEQVVDYAAAAGFRALEVCCWPAGSGDERRYAGTTHIDVAGLDETKAGEIRALQIGRAHV